MIYNFSSLNDIKFGNFEENTKNFYNNKVNKLNLKYATLNSSKNKMFKYNNNKHTNKFINKKIKIYRNKNQISYKQINKTEINSINNKEKQKKLIDMPMVSYLYFISLISKSLYIKC